ncbi:MAG: glycosyltransferase [Propionibacteriaceae bacterium]|nr:glycosyltransferase [Propionibacteriaceae bacterium]
MATPLVSIIVPVYNVERYLPKCLHSVVSQTLRNIEIICVNDGSTDGSLAIMESFAKSDPRITILSHPNHGYGYSMNRGIRKATGKYIGIVESDDWADPIMFEQLSDFAEANDAQIVKSNFYMDWTAPSVRSEVFEYFDYTEHGITITPRNYDGAKLFRKKPSIWSAIYSREFVTSNHIEFLETPGASYQDTSFAFKAFALADRMTCVSRAYIHYRQDNEESSVNSRGKAFCVCDEYEAIEEFIESSPDLHSLYGIEVPTIYDSFIWNYERLDQTLKYPFLVRVSEWFNHLIDDGKVNWNFFSRQQWKKEGFQSIAHEPMSYHTWREDEKAQKLGAKATIHPIPAGFVPHPSVDTPFISVVVPVYKVEAYLRGCLESLVNQTFEDIEIICVDDGSPDDSALILKEYAQRDSRVRVITKNNGGLSSARNAGLKIAQGEYVLFVDSDDWVSVKCCEVLHETLDGRDPVDAVVFGTTIYPGVPRPSQWLHETLTVMKGYRERITLDDLFNESCFRVFSWRHCFRRDFLLDNELTFPEGTPFGEDVVFSFLAFPKVTHGVVTLSDELYRYRHYRANSLMNTATNNPSRFTQKQLTIISEVLDIIYSYSEAASPDKVLQLALEFMYGAITSCPEPGKSLQIRKFLKLLSKHHLLGATENLNKAQSNFLRDLQRHPNVLLNLWKVGRSDWIVQPLRRVVPPSRAGFARRMKTLEKRLDQQQQMLASIRNSVNELVQLIEAERNETPESQETRP